VFILARLNIPLHKTSNPRFKFWKNILQEKSLFSSDSTLPKTYVSDIYKEAMKNIREKVSGNKIWVSINEKTDSKDRYVANIIIGTDSRV